MQRGVESAPTRCGTDTIMTELALAAVMTLAGLARSDCSTWSTLRRHIASSPATAWRAAPGARGGGDGLHGGRISLASPPTLQTWAGKSGQGGQENSETPGSRKSETREG